MPNLTHRERVRCATAHQEPDRVPLGAYTMTDVCYTQPAPTPRACARASTILGDISDVVVPHEDVLQHFDLDTRDVSLDDGDAPALDLGERRVLRGQPGRRIPQARGLLLLRR